VFKEAGLDIGSVPCVDDIDLEGLCLQQRLRLTLVDHNTPCVEQGVLWPAVVEIVDHHVDEGKHLEAKRQIAMVASTTTLVTTELLKSPLLSVSVATLLQACVLLDTRNLNAAEVNYLPPDREAATALQEITGRDPAKFYEDLFRRRLDVSGLPLRDLLRKDSKFVATGDLRFCMSSLAGISLDELAQSFPDWQQDLLSCCKGSGWDLLVVMMAYSVDTQFRRHLVIAGGELVSPLHEYLSRSESKLDLEPLPSFSVFSSPAVLSFCQRNVKASRKQVLPLVRQFIGLLGAADTAALKRKRELDPPSR